MRCFDARIARIAPLVDAGRPMPLQEPAEKQCVDESVAAALALRVPPGKPTDAWWVSLEAYRSCRGEIAFASVSSGDLRTLSGSEQATEQAAWLRSHVTECKSALASLQALAAPAAPAP